MMEVSIGLVAFSCLSVAFLTVLRFHHLLPESHRSGDTLAVVRLGTGVVATLSALVLGLVLSTVETSYANASRDIRVFAGEIEQLDEVLHAIGPGATRARKLLEAYVDRVLGTTWHASGPAVDDRGGDQLLATLETAIVALPRPNDGTAHFDDRAATLAAALAAAHQQIVVDDARVLPPLFLILLVLWLTILFGSFGYCAPRNATVVLSILLVAATVATGLFLMVEMDGSFTGLIMVSDAPLRQVARALHTG